MGIEEWRPVVGFEEKYEVSSHGRVRSIPRWSCEGQGRHWIPGGIRALTPGQGGYFRVWISPDWSPTVHRIATEAFLGPRPEGMVVRHLDGDCKNNHIDNLKYGTHSENQLDRVKHGRNAHANKTECPQGHLYDEENTRIRPSGARECKECDRQRRRDYVALNRDEINRKRRKSA